MKHDRIPLNDLSALHAPLRDEISATVESVLSSGRFIGGEAVTAFESELAEFLGVNQGRVVSCSSGTDAILMALMAAGLGEGDRIAVPTFTFGAPAIGIRRIGAEPIFMDVDPDTMNIDVDGVTELDIKAIIPVHLFGRCVDMQALTNLANENGWIVIEDAAQAIGSTSAGMPSATAGDFGCFSFFPTKNLGAIGDAGAVVSKTDDGAKALREIRHHGSSTKYVHERLGGNFRMDALQAAVLSIKLRHIDGWNARRREIAKIYLDRDPEEGHTYHRFVIQCDDRARARAKFLEAGIDTAIYYPVPLHQMPLFKTDISCPVSEQLCQTALAVPIFPSMTSSQIERVKHVLDSIDATF